MSFLAKLTVDGKEYNVLHCTYNFEQPVDATGKPEARPLGGKITATIEADGSYDLLHWMASAEQIKDGTLTFISAMQCQGSNRSSSKKLIASALRPNSTHLTTLLYNKQL